MSGSFLSAEHRNELPALEINLRREDGNSSMQNIKTEGGDLLLREMSNW